MAGDDGDDAVVVSRPKEMSSSMTCPMLNETNYTVWALRMKVLLRIHKVWETIEPGSLSLEKNDVATGLIFQSIPEYLVLQVGEKETAKEIWDAIKTRNLGAERVKEARLQTLNSDFERLTMKDTDSIEYFAGKLKEISSKSTSFGQTIEESKLVKKFLNSLPPSKYIQIAASLEQVLDLNTTTFEDIVGRLKAYEERIRHGESYGGIQDKLLYANTEDCSNTSSSGGRGRGRGNRGRGKGRNNSQRSTDQGDKNKSKEKKDLSKIICYRCDKPGHYASSCPERTQKIEEANKVETEEADSALYMHEIVFLNEENLIPRNYETKKGEEGVWYLDNGASNHMTGVRTFFSELNENIKGKVKFGDGSYVDIVGKGTIVFVGKTGEKRALKEIYYIPDLKNNIISLGQATENGCEVHMKGDTLSLTDPYGRLLVQVMRSPNRLYKTPMEISYPRCLLKEEEANDNQILKGSKLVEMRGFIGVQDMTKTKSKLKREIVGFCERAQALIHGDLHTGSVMVTQDSTQVLDPEFSFYGPMGFDIGAYLGNLILAFFAQDGHAAEGNDRKEYKQWILRTIEQTWNLFDKKFIALWDQNKDGPGEAYLADIYNNAEVLQLVQEKYMKNLLHDSLGFGAAKMIRRIVGVAHVEDFESIEEDKRRAVCERSALEFAKMLLKERRKFKSIGEVVSAIQQQS